MTHHESWMTHHEGGEVESWMTHHSTPLNVAPLPLLSSASRSQACGKRLGVPSSRLGN